MPKKKKRVIKKKPKTVAKRKNKRTVKPKKETNLGWSVFSIVLIVAIIIILLVSLKPCDNCEEENETIPETPCEQRGFECMDSCSGDYFEVDLACGANKFCCEYIEPENNECKQEGESISVGEECCSGLEKASDCIPNVPCPVSLRYCILCGDGVCREHENRLNCPEDCNTSVCTNSGGFCLTTCPTEYGYAEVDLQCDRGVCCMAN